MTEAISCGQLIARLVPGLDHFTLFIHKDVLCHVLAMQPSRMSPNSLISLCLGVLILKKWGSLYQLHKAAQQTTRQHLAGAGPQDCSVDGTSIMIQSFLNMHPKRQIRCRYNMFSEVLCIITL